MRLNLPLLTASIVALSFVAAPGSASAACKKMAFLVNDYGKDGPTKDAKELLDKEIAKWAADNGITKYNVGKKDVKCELFLDVLLFDEHTCTASAQVCWGEGAGEAKPAATAGEATKKPSKPAVETGAISTDADAPAKPESKAAPVETPAAEKRSEAPPAEADAAERAAAAAERAAAAAERAAAAAEKASGAPAAQ